MTDEEWRDIEGSGSRYEVSSYGRVRSKGRVILRSNGRPQTIRSRILSQSVDEWGYPQVGIDGRTRKVHSLVAKAFLGEKPFSSAQIRHLDGDSRNNSVVNLCYGTPSENVLDGYSYRGSIRDRQKLTEDQAGEIKRRLGLGETGKSLAREFGVSQQTVCDIKHDRIYRRVKA